VIGLIRTLHAWSGAALSALALILGLTGALLTLQPEWLRLNFQQARVSAPATPQALGVVAEAAEHAFGEQPKYLTFARPGEGLHHLTLADGRYAYLASDGRTVAVWKGRTRPETFIYDLHHYLLTGETGMKVAGLAGLALLVMVLSGLIVWAPGWRATRLQLWPRSIGKPELRAAHRNIGLIFAGPVFLFCLTGSAMVFVETTQKVLTDAFPGPEVEEFFPPPDDGDIDWPKALTAAQAAFPDARLRVLIWPSFPGGRAQILMKQPGEWNPEGKTKVVINPATSAVLGTVDAKAFSKGRRYYAALYPIHTATAGGLVYRLFALLSGLAMAALGVIGLWAFLIKPRRRQPRV